MHRYLSVWQLLQLQPKENIQFSQAKYMHHFMHVCLSVSYFSHYKFHVAKLVEITGKTRVLYSELGEITGKTPVLPYGIFFVIISGGLIANG